MKTGGLVKKAWKSSLLFVLYHLVVYIYTYLHDVNTVLGAESPIVTLPCEAAAQTVTGARFEARLPEVQS